MFREFLRVKVHNATVTETQLQYEGSITLDPSLIRKAGLLPNEKVEVVNLNNGARFCTFVIAAGEDSGRVCLNGPAARLGQQGDRIHILAYALADEKELAGFKTTFVFLSKANRIRKTRVTGLELP